MLNNSCDLRNPGGSLYFGVSFGWFAGESACIGDDLAFRVLDRNGNPLRHHAFGTEADAEIHDGFERQSAFGEIRMFALQLVQTELQRLVGRAVFRAGAGFAAGLRLPVGASLVFGASLGFSASSLGIWLTWLQGQD